MPGSPPSPQPAISATSPVLPVTGPGASRRPGPAQRGQAITGMASRLTLAATLVTCFTATACSVAPSPANQGGPAASSPAGQAGQDPGCQAIESQASGVASQLAADSGNYSAQVPVLRTGEGDLQAAWQKARSSLVLQRRAQGRDAGKVSTSGRPPPGRCPKGCSSRNRAADLARTSLARDRADRPSRRTTARLWPHVLDQRRLLASSSCR
jgi:hypothetical protein